jgi:hypothetical protein
MLNDNQFDFKLKDDYEENVDLLDRREDFTNVGDFKFQTSQQSYIPRKSSQI